MKIHFRTLLRTLAPFLVAAFLLPAFASCNKDEKNEPTPPDNTVTTPIDKNDPTNVDKVTFE